MALALVAAVAVGCHEDEKKKPATDAGVPVEDAGDFPPATGEDGGTDAGGPGADAGALDARCAAACETLSGLAETLCGSTSTSHPAGDLLRRFGLRAATPARAFELASSAAPSMAQLRDMVGAPVRYAPRAGVLMLQRPTTEAVTRLTGALPVLRELPVLVTSAGREVVVPGRFVLKLKPGARVDALLAKVGARLVRPLNVGARAYLAQVDDPMDAFRAVEALRGQAGVAYAEPSLVRSYTKRGPVVDPLTASQWHLQPAPQTGATAGSNILADQAWLVSEGKPETIIGIFDDGVDYEHPDLKGAIVPGLNVPDDLSQAVNDQCCWHGSAVAGVAAAQANDIGLRGVCPTCSLMPIFDPAYASGTDTGAMMEDAATAETFSDACRTAAVINNSWGPADGDPAVAEPDGQLEQLPTVIDEALKQCETQGRGGLGTVIVFAAGNGNESADFDPFASYPLVIGVAATDDTGHKAYYSDFGDTVDVSAPSSGGRTPGIWTTALRGSGDLPGGDYMDYFGGTSSAAPVVTGLVGLVLSINPALTAAQVRQLVRDTADKIDRLHGEYDDAGFSRIYGYGRVNALRAVREAERLAGTCKALDSESCNGVDDDCDGTVDEDCVKAAACEPCTFDGGCASGLCVQTPNDAEPRCLEACVEGACGDGFTCQAGACVPADGRCAEPVDETCNGVDDNVDGRVDEGVCNADVPCTVDESCGPGNVCSVGTCLPTCSDDVPCANANATCSERTDRYGKTDGIKVCVEPFDPCLAYICTLPEEAPREQFITCVAGNPASCEDVYACIPEEAF